MCCRASGSFATSLGRARRSIIPGSLIAPQDHVSVRRQSSPVRRNGNANVGFRETGPYRPASANDRKRRNLAVHQGVDEGRVAALLRTSIIAACTKRGWWYEIPSYPCEP